MKKYSFFIVSILLLVMSPGTPNAQVKTAPLKTVMKPVPTIWVTRPGVDVTWYAGSGTSYPVEWTTSGTFATPNLNIHLCDEAGNMMLDRLAVNTLNDGNENVEPRLNQAEGIYTVRVETADGVVKGISKPFFIRTSPFILVVPAGNLVRGRTYSIGWRTNQASSLRIDILLRREGSMVAELVLARQVPNSGRAEIRIPAGTVPGTYRIEIQPGGSFGGMSFLSAPFRVVS